MRGAKPFLNFRGSDKGVSLIIAVFSLMLLAVLGLTMAMMISGDFQMNNRDLESEQAFNLADAGIQEALKHLSLVSQGDTSFENDTDHLYRRLGNGEYNVTRQIYGAAVNVTSRGYVPSQANYRAMRQVKIVAIPSSGLGVTAFTGGNFFDWHYTRGYSINVAGDIASAHYEGSDANTIWDQNATQTSPSDFAVPGSGKRIVSSGQLPALDLDYFRSIADSHYYSDQTYSGNNNNLGKVFVEGNVTINTPAKLLHANIFATGNIKIKGAGQLTMKVNVEPSGKCYPALATQNGSITAEGPSGCDAGIHSIEGFVYSQYGTVDFNCIDGNSVMGNEVRLRTNVNLVYDGKYQDMSHGFSVTGGGISHSWQEE